jgi:hypothetical protein
VTPYPDSRLPAVPPSATLLRNDDDACRYVRRTLVLTLVVYAMLGAALAGWVTPWLFIALPLVYVRLSLALHELMHVRPASRVSWFHRLAMIFDTPFGLGYREHRAIHLAHHRYAATARDPELYQIRGSHLRAFGNAMIAPERALVGWARRRGVAPALRREALARAAIFVALAAIDPAVFALYWVTLRACIGCSSFLFHHVLHSRGGALGNFALSPAMLRVLPAARLLFGIEPVLIIRDHRLHHDQPGVRARDLPMLDPAAPARAEPSYDARHVIPATPR